MIISQKYCVLPPFREAFGGQYVLRLERLSSHMHLPLPNSIAGTLPAVCDVSSVLSGLLCCRPLCFVCAPGVLWLDAFPFAVSVHAGHMFSMCFVIVLRASGWGGSGRFIEGDLVDACLSLALEWPSGGR